MGRQNARVSWKALEGRRAVERRIPWIAKDLKDVMIVECGNVDNAA